MPESQRPPEPERLLSVGEVAQFLGVGESWVYGAAESNRVPSFRIGKYRRFRLSEILTWLEKQRASEGRR
jgi:excisionase family DNA binding protein